MNVKTIAASILTAAAITTASATAASALERPPIPSDCCFTERAPIASDIPPYGLRPPHIVNRRTLFAWHRWQYRTFTQRPPAISGATHRFVVPPRIAP